MEKRISSISNHYIVCGYGRVGKVVCEELNRQGTSFIVIERASVMIEEIKAMSYLYIQGDCTDDETLLKAEIDRAKGLISTIADEADAVYIVLTARQHNSTLFITARADSTIVEQKLKRAGADRVISPQATAGTRMVMAALRPNVVDFMALASMNDKSGLRIEEMRVPDGCRLIGQSFKEIEVRAKYGLNVIGVRKSGGQMMYNPTADYIVSDGDTLIMVGGGDQLSRIDELFGQSI
jgi:voltage-gated potassium channel